MLWEYKNVKFFREKELMNSFLSLFYLIFGNVIFVKKVIYLVIFEFGFFYEI